MLIVWLFSLIILSEAGTVIPIITTTPAPPTLAPIGAGFYVVVTVSGVALAVVMGIIFYWCCCMKSYDNNVKMKKNYQHLLGGGTVGAGSSQDMFEGIVAKYE